MHRYLPHTKKDIEMMLSSLGLKHMDELFAHIPSEFILKEPYDIPKSLSEYAMSMHMQQLANKNKILKIFRGYGAYDHFIPAIIKPLISRQEFLTSYTPYQPEVSQGTLHYIFEFQSMVSALTGMEVSNASMYDGATATAEAVMMSYANNPKPILVSATLHPKTIEVIQTYAHYKQIPIVVLDEKQGITDFGQLKSMTNYSALVVGNPNKYGIIENYEGYRDVLDQQGAWLIMNYDAQSLSLLKTPKEYHADIACGEMQSLGLPLSFGGAYLGYLATDLKHVRKMPGRICGLTKDVRGQDGFVLTFQAREQHIRRAKANSNICSNQSLNALAATIYLSVMGKKGFVQAGQACVNAAHYLYESLLKTKYFTTTFEQPFFKEFTVNTTLDLKRLNTFLLKKGVLGPVDLGNQRALFAVTEKTSKMDIDQLVAWIGEFK